MEEREALAEAKGIEIGTARSARKRLKQGVDLEAIASQEECDAKDLEALLAKHPEPANAPTE
jgi:hypothetical protein